MIASLVLVRTAMGDRRALKGLSKFADHMGHLVLQGELELLQLLFLHQIVLGEKGFAGQFHQAQLVAMVLFVKAPKIRV
jgi:hypothetical protein